MEDHATDGEEQMAHVIERNIHALLHRKKQEDKSKSLEEKIADAVTRFTGSMQFVYIHIVLIGAWIFWNLGWFGLEKFDPSFVILAMAASVEAIFLSTFVLISQNRMNKQADKRAELDLQISLLTEHEVTRLITIVTEIARKMKIEHGHEDEIEELAKEVHPAKMLDTIEQITNEKKS
jgi:uncharacterized membrane protein